MARNMIGLIDIELAKSWRARRSKELDRLFDIRREKARKEHARLAIGLLTVFYSSCIGLDVIFFPDIMPLVIAVRLGIAPLIGGLAFLYCRSGPGVVVDARNTIAVVLSAALLAILLISTRNDQGFVNYYALLPLLFIACNIFCAAPLRMAAAGSVAITVLMSLPLIGRETPPTFVAGTLSQMVWMSILTLFLNWRSGRERFRAFLQTIKSEAQQTLIEERNADLQRLSETDALTGAMNRRSIDNALAAFWQGWSVEKQPFALMFLDVDHFKSYNDAYGHVAGDDCLTWVSHAMQDAVTPHGGVVGRFGGEEFLAIFPCASREVAWAVAEAVSGAVRDLMVPHAKRLDGIRVVTISAGVAMSVLADVDAPGTMMRLADKALYQAKKAGRNRFHLAGDADGLARADKGAGEPRRATSQRAAVLMEPFGLSEVA